MSRPCALTRFLAVGADALILLSVMALWMACLGAVTVAQAQGTGAAAAPAGSPAHGSLLTVDTLAAALSLDDVAAPLLLGEAGLPATVPSQPLRLHEVIAALERTHPKLESAARKVDTAEAKQWAAEGMWDPYLRLEGKTTPFGYYNHSELDASIHQTTPLRGLRLYAGYRRGIGDYPVYKGELETLSGGELRAGVELPLWKDGSIDAGRAELAQRKAYASAAHCGRDAVGLHLRNYAARSYWKWVLAGQNVRIQSALLQVAQDRDAAIRQQVALGSSPPIAITDNRRMLMERQAKFIAAERDFKDAAVGLSLFFRDEQLRPMVVDGARVPLTVPAVEHLPASDQGADVKLALAQRPELCELLGEQTAARVALRLAENQQAPLISLQAEVARDVGSGKGSLEKTDVLMGIKVAMPLLLRKARGDRAAADAQLAGIGASLRALRDQMAAEITQARVGLTAAHDQVAVAQTQLQAAQELADAEREKLAEGASDLVVVNLRELAVAEAARMLAEARVALQISLVDYRTALGSPLMVEPER